VTDCLYSCHCADTDVKKIEPNQKNQWKYLPCISHNAIISLMDFRLGGSLPYAFAFSSRLYPLWLLIVNLSCLIFFCTASIHLLFVCICFIVCTILPSLFVLHFHSTYTPCGHIIYSYLTSSTLSLMHATPTSCCLFLLLFLSFDVTPSIQLSIWISVLFNNSSFLLNDQVSAL